MEEYLVTSIQRPINWNVKVPGSKSITNRALLLAAQCKECVQLQGVLFSDDSRYFLQALQSLGYEVTADEASCRVTLKGRGRELPSRQGEIYVGSAGTAARFLTAMLGVSAGTFVIQSSPQMQRRPMEELFRALQSLGAEMEWLGEPWHLPVRITGADLCQKLDDSKPMEISLDISHSTQFLSAFLLIAPMLAGGLKIHITGDKKDGSYIRITRRMMEEFGVQAGFDGETYTVPAGSFYDRSAYLIEPDVSAACYFYAAAAITGGRVLVQRVHGNGMQGDLKFLKVLEAMGCKIFDTREGILLDGPSGMAGLPAPELRAGVPELLQGIAVDMNDFSDQALTLAAIAPYAAGPVTIKHIGHIRGQECDRLHAMVYNLEAAGISCREQEDGITIFPGVPESCEIETYDDHRVAMAFTVMGLKTQGIRIRNPLCCKKTFAGYFDTLDKLMRDGNCNF